MSTNPLAPSWLVEPDDANALPTAVWSLNADRSESGEIEIAGVGASALAAEFGTPVYVVDEADTRTRARRIRESFDREFARVGSSAKVYYAGKAFLSTEVARWVTGIEAGNLYVNRPITGAIVGRQPFGGFRLSGIGTKAGGPDYLLQFVVPRTITENTLRRGFAPALAAEDHHQL